MNSRFGTGAVLIARIAAAFTLLIGVGLGNAGPANAQSTTTITIAGFAFSPANVTVQAGDTVVFVNNDSVAHTATANDGSFDTGTIQPGSSASVTFSSAGTFSYFCQIHPNMTGSITVTAVDDGSGTDGGSGEPTTELPDTGTGPLGSSSDQLALMLAVASLALLLGAAGYALRAGRS
jgi:plastocyanin